MKFSYTIENRLSYRNLFAINFCGNFKGKTVLDIGCSYGWVEKMAIKRGVKKIIGIEPKAELFYQAKKQVPEAEFVPGKAEDLPFGDKSFDQVIMFEVFEHTPPGHEEKIIQEIYRVLKPGGQLVFSTPHRHLLSCLLDPAWYFGHRHFSLKYLTSLLKKSDLKVQKLTLYGGFWELFRMIPHYLFKWILKTEDPLKNFFNKKIKNDYKNTGYAYIYLKAKK